MQCIAALWGATATQKEPCGGLLITGFITRRAIQRMIRIILEMDSGMLTGCGFSTRRALKRIWARFPSSPRFPELRLIDRLWFVPPIALGCMLFVLGGWHWVVWGYFVSTFLLSNATYTINSLMHYWGKQQYFTGDESRNHWLLALITLGEGWHNNHHRYQASTRNGFFRGEFDITYWLLKLFLSVVS